MKGFIYSCIGDNTPENREHLEKLGYKEYLPKEQVQFLFYLVTYKDGDVWKYKYWDAFGVGECNPDHINCIGNPALFQAVTAVSSTTDIGKHYINNHTGQWKRCDYNMATDENIDWDDWTEATLAELQEHFKHV